MSLLPVILTTLLAAGGGEASPAAGARESLFAVLPENPMDGGKLFAEKGCLTCHAIQGVGGEGGPDIARGLLNYPILDIAGVMWNHSPRMEHAFQGRHVTRPKFEAAEMAKLLSFLYYLGSFERPGNPAEGERLFRDRMCNKCHMLGGRGGNVAGKLDGYGKYASPLALTSALWNHGPRMSSKMRSAAVPRPSFTGTELADLLAYVRTESGSTEREYALPGNPRRGEELFKAKHCAECHLEGHAKGVGPDLAVTVKGSLMQISGSLWNHAPTMWEKMEQRAIAMPQISPTEMADLVSYLYFLQFIDQVGDASRGQVVFRDAQCGLCHGQDGGPGKAAPQLIGQGERFRSALAVVAAMWNHAGQMEEAMTKLNVTWPVLKRGEMADLVAYLVAGEGAKAPPGGAANQP